MDSSRLVGSSGDDPDGVGRTFRSLEFAAVGVRRQRPSELVFESLRYLKNNADRMRYDDYRRQGLPIMTSAVESVIKMINKRVKGSEKFWSEPGAEAILQLRADYLSETEAMTRFWTRARRRPAAVVAYRLAS